MVASSDIGAGPEIAEAVEEIDWLLSVAIQDDTAL